jgi:hypothetical protein
MLMISSFSGYYTKLSYKLRRLKLPFSGSSNPRRASNIWERTWCNIPEDFYSHLTTIMPVYLN